MSVLKQYNPATSQWEAVVLGKQGPSGTVAVTAPLTNSGTSTAAVLGVDYSTLQYGQNAIINGGMDVWQRGASFSSVAAYCADRWYSDTANKVTRSTDVPVNQGFTYSAKFTNTVDNAALRQAIELPVAGSQGQFYDGSTWTASFWVKLSAGTRSIGMYVAFTAGIGAEQRPVLLDTTSKTATASWQRVSYTFTIPSGASIASATSLQFTPFIVGTGSLVDVYFTGLQLENGSVATPFKRAAGTIQGELAACQRYYYRLTADANNLYPLWAMGSATNTSQAQFSIPLKQTMRTYPQSVDYAVLGITHDNATQYAATSISLVGNNLNTNTAHIAVNTSGLTAYRPYFLFGTNSASNYIGFSAEL